MAPFSQILEPPPNPGRFRLYLAVVMDLYTRMIIGWSMADRMDTSLVLNALRMARLGHQPKQSVLHHSDRGSQYCSKIYLKELTDHGMTCSMSRKGNCWNNAPMESFFNSLKNERVHHQCYRNRDDAKQGIFEYIEAFYNRRRRHSALNYLSPCEYYAAWLGQGKWRLEAYDGRRFSQASSECIARINFGQDL